MKWLRSNRLFFLPYLLFLLVGGWVLLHYPKGDFEILVNRSLFPAASRFFYYATALGNGWFFALAVLVMLTLSVRKALLLTLSGLVCIGLSPLLKNVLFPDSPRPIQYLQGVYHFRLVDGVEVFYNNSFPSGHTLSAFALFSMLCFLSRKEGWKLLCFVLALTAAFSRVYLAQHFFRDIYAGSILGTAVSTLVYTLLQRRMPASSKADRPIWALFRKGGLPG